MKRENRWNNEEIEVIIVLCIEKKRRDQDTQDKIVRTGTELNRPYFHRKTVVCSSSDIFIRWEKMSR